MKIGNINTKVLAASLSLVMTTTFLGGCYDNFSYTTDSEGNVQIEGHVEHKLVKDSYKIIETELHGKREIYLVKKVLNSQSVSYYDVFNNYLILNVLKDNNETTGDSDINLISENNFSDYLIYYDEVKGNYSEEDLKRVLDKIKNDYVFETEEAKTLVKERN